MKNLVFRSLQEKEIRAIIITLASLFSQEFNITRFNSPKLNNSSFYIINSNDEDFSATLNFADKNSAMPILDNMLEYLISKKDATDYSIDWKYDNDYRILCIEELLNSCKNHIHNPEDTEEFDEEGNLNYDSMEFLANFGLIQLTSFINENTNQESEEYQSLYLATLLLDECLDSDKELHDELFEKFNEYYFRYSIDDQCLYNDSTKWATYPDEKDHSGNIEKLRAKLLTISYLDESLDSSINVSSHLGNALTLSYRRHHKNKSMNNAFFHNKVTNFQETCNTRYNMFNTIKPLDIVYRLFGEKNQFLNKKKEEQILSRLPIKCNTLEDFFSYQLQGKDLLEKVNIGNNHRLISAMILNFATLDNIKSGTNKEFDDNCELVSKTGKFKRGKLLSKIFDTNYELVLHDPTLSANLLKQVSNQQENER